MFFIHIHSFIRDKAGTSNFDGSVERTARKGVVVLWVDNNLHDVVGVSFEHLGTDPFLLPVPQLYQHVI